MTDRYEEAPIKKLAAFFYEDEIERLNGEIERLREVLRKIACDDDTCDCRAFNSHDAMCELGFARAALEGKE